MKMKHTLKQVSIACLLTSTLMLASCASIVHGTSEDFTVASQPTHAKLSVDGVAAGRTPKQINLTRKNDHVVRLKLAGYQPASFHLKRTMSGWFFANIAFGGIIGIAVDGFDGAMYKLTPQEMSQYAEQNNIRYVSKSHTITVILVRRANRHWKKIGQLKKV